MRVPSRWQPTQAFDRGLLRVEAVRGVAARAAELRDAPLRVHRLARAARLSSARALRRAACRACRRGSPCVSGSWQLARIVIGRFTHAARLVLGLVAAAAVHAGRAWPSRASRPRPCAAWIRGASAAVWLQGNGRRIAGPFAATSRKLRAGNAARPVSAAARSSASPGSPRTARGCRGTCGSPRELQVSKPMPSWLGRSLAMSCVAVEAEVPASVTPIGSVISRAGARRGRSRTAWRRASRGRSALRGSVNLLRGCLSIASFSSWPWQRSHDSCSRRRGRRRRARVAALAGELDLVVAVRGLARQEHRARGRERSGLLAALFVSRPGGEVAADAEAQHAPQDPVDLSPRFAMPLRSSSVLKTWSAEQDRNRPEEQGCASTSRCAAAARRAAPSRCSSAITPPGDRADRDDAEEGRRSARSSGSSRAGRRCARRGRRA